MKNKNIVIFSSGLSEERGITENIKNRLNRMGYSCVDWRGLFTYAHKSESIALLPMLIKKIPTFDFAVLICEGHDITYISRGQSSETVKTMRDNVLFEIGLCAMAIGLSRTIIVTDTDVHLPDDLKGIDGKLALKQIKFNEHIFSPEKRDKDTCFDMICEEIDGYIKLEGKYLHQVVIGAAASGACGYAANFVCRALEHIDDELTIFDGENKKSVRISPEKVYMHIFLPNNLDQKILAEIKEKQAELLHGRISSSRNRPVDFNCFFDEDGALHIVDYPTNVVTSYDTARMILQMDADDSPDVRASERFIEKELSLYESTLKTILNETFIIQVIEEHYADATDREKEKMLRNVVDVVKKRFTVEVYDNGIRTVI